MNKESIQSFCHKQWDESIIPELIDYIKIPNKSPMFDPEWKEHGYMEKVVTQFTNWIKKQAIDDLVLEVVCLDGRTPLIYMEIPGQSDDTVLLYGHLDKQPEMTGWHDRLGPWKPVLDGDKLYGRGGADDGYAMFSSLTAIMALQKDNIPHSRCVVIIEACEESGSYDLPFYIDHLSDHIGHPSLVICLDSGCGNYEQLWMTSSLRGLIGGELHVKVLKEGVHSGDASGVVPSSFRIIRQLLDRLEDAATGELLTKEFYVDIPAQRHEQAKNAAKMLGNALFDRFPLQGETQLIEENTAELILNRSWRPALSYVGADGLTDIQSAGNVLRANTALKLSMRIPPICDADKSSAKLKELLESDPPYGADVKFIPDWAAGGWMAPDVEPWLEKALDEASKNYFGKPAVHMGEGWSIPFMGMLGEKYPDAQFVITGVLGPGSNAHGPNEFLHIPMAKKLTCCITEVIARQYQHFQNTN